MAFSVGIAFTSEYFDPTIRTPNEAYRLLEVPVLAWLPASEPAVLRPPIYRNRTTEGGDPVNTLRALLAETPPAAEQPRTTPITEQVQREAVSPMASVHAEQIHALVQQLFFRPESRPVRHVGFATIEPSTATATSMPRGRQSSGCRGPVRRRADRRLPGLGPSANPAADSLPQPCGGHLADRTSAVDGSSPELATGRRRAPFDRSELIAAPRTHDGVRLFHSVVCSCLLAYGEHCPSLRRPGAGADRQQNKTPCRRTNQGPAEQGASSSARNRPRGTPFSRAAGPVPESVNLMGELTTNRLWNTGPKDCPSQYSRMIPGTARNAALPGSRRPPPLHVQRKKKTKPPAPDAVRRERQLDDSNTTNCHRSIHAL